MNMERSMSRVPLLHQPLGGMKAGPRCSLPRLCSRAQGVMGQWWGVTVATT